MNINNLSIGIAGFGLMGQLYPDILRKRGIAKIKIASREPSKDSQLEFYDDYKKLQDIDAVIISLPINLHLEAVEFFAPRVSYILIEKPLETNYTRSKKLVEIIKKYKTGAMCGLTGLYHPEFEAMYSVLPRLGEIDRVIEQIHDLHPRFKNICKKSERGVLTGNGIHTLHRFYKIAQMAGLGSKPKIQKIELAHKYFQDCLGEDYASGKLYFKKVPFEFDLSFRDDPENKNGLPTPIEYIVEIFGQNGKIKVTGWEKCESWIDGKYTLYYAHPEGPLGKRSQYTRLGIGLERQIDEFLRFIESGEKTHFTLREALIVHKILEDCYQAAKAQ